MTVALNLFILAGEPSGDRIAADLVRRLRLRTSLVISGVGGGDLIAEGLAPLFPMSDLSVMGLSDVLKRLPLLLWRIEQTARAILKSRPDIVVLVDAQEFSARLAKRLRAKGFASPILLYVSPSVWARHPERAAQLRPLFNEVLAVLPFEPAIMKRLDGPPTSYVGHPALAEPAPHPVGGPDQIALLPGSRSGELRRHLPLLKDVAERLSGRFGIGGFFLPTLPGLADRLKAEVGAWNVDVEIVSDRAERDARYSRTRLALATAGTATLELALANVPMLVTYVMEPAQIRYFERLGRPRVGLPNIILAADVTPELILPGLRPAPVLAAAEELLGSPKKLQAQREAFSRLRLMMENGLPDAPRQDPADRVLAHLGRVI